MLNFSIFISYFGLKLLIEYWDIYHQERINISEWIILIIKFTKFELILCKKIPQNDRQCDYSVKIRRNIIMFRCFALNFFLFVNSFSFEKERKPKISVRINPCGEFLACRGLWCFIIINICYMVSTKWFLRIKLLPFDYLFIYFRPKFINFFFFLEKNHFFPFP